jgi:peroxiredoxin
MKPSGNASRTVSRLTLALAATTCWIGAGAVVAYEPKTLEIGAAAPDFNLIGTDDQRHSLAEYADSEILVVIFTTNHCPDAIASYPRMRQMVDDYRDRKVGFVAINGNNPQSVMLDELRWTRYDDTFESMKIVAKDEHFNLPYLYDGETQAVTKAYGAVATPHVFIFDRQRKLQYTGRLDSGRRNPGAAATSESREAIDALLAGKPVPTPKTHVFGCSTKWIEDRPLVAQSDETWNERPVTLSPIDATEIKRLIANDSSGLRLINIWSTTCGPCVAEFPDLVKTYRRFQNHPFELITVSVDTPSEQEQVANFLQDQHAALARRTERHIKSSGRRTNNFIFSGDDLESLAPAVDSQWTGVQPFTILVAPGGNVLYHQTGKIDFDMLNETIAKYARDNFLK